MVHVREVRVVSAESVRPAAPGPAGGCRIVHRRRTVPLACRHVVGHPAAGRLVAEHLAAPGRLARSAECRRIATRCNACGRCRCESIPLCSCSVRRRYPLRRCCRHPAWWSRPAGYRGRTPTAVVTAAAKAHRGWSLVWSFPRELLVFAYRASRRWEPPLESPAKSARNRRL